MDKKFWRALLVAVLCAMWMPGVSASETASEVRPKLIEDGMFTARTVVTIMNPDGAYVMEFAASDGMLDDTGIQRRSFGETCVVAPRTIFQRVGEDGGRVLVEQVGDSELLFRDLPTGGSVTYTCKHDTLYWLPRAEYLAGVRALAADDAAKRKAAGDRERELATVERLLRERDEAIERAMRLPAEAPPPAKPKPAAKAAKRP